MNQPDAVRGSNEVVFELMQLERDLVAARSAMEYAQKVIVAARELRPRLLGELNVGLASIGLQCYSVAPTEAASIETLVVNLGADSAEVFAGLYSAVFGKDLPPLQPDAPDLERQVTAEAVPAPEPTPVKLDMSKPINWVRGDIFSENPRFTLPHQRGEWEVHSLDVSDLKNLRGLDIEIQRVGTNEVELMTIEQFMARYVFVRHAESAAE